MDSDINSRANVFISVLSPDAFSKRDAARGTKTPENGREVKSEPYLIGRINGAAMFIKRSRAISFPCDPFLFSFYAIRRNVMQTRAEPLRRRANIASNSSEDNAYQTFARHRR